MPISQILLLSFFFILSACAEADDAPAPSNKELSIEITTVADNLRHPWGMVFLPNGDYLVSERRGKLWHISKDGQQRFEVTGVPKVYHEGQGGLLGLALEPDFKDGGWLYMSYAGSAANDYDTANTEVARAKFYYSQNRLSDLDVIFKATPKVEGGNHWGSRLVFANDGTLYITLGDRYSYRDEAQNPQNNLGTVARIHADGSIPADNPFADGQNGHPTVFSYGHRNGQGMALHPETGAIWMHEHGPKGGDEINILKKGANYGWPKATFGINYIGTTISDKTSIEGMEDSILHWTPSIAPSGMIIYSGDKFPDWQGDVFVGALAGKHLRHVEMDGDTPRGQQALLSNFDKRIRDVAQGPDGYIYILTDEYNGGIYRISPR